MSKILILANNDVGLYKFRKELIQELLKKNEVFISLPYGSYVDDLVEIGCEFIETPVDRRGMNPLKDLKLLNNYMKMIKKVNPSKIITYTIKPNIYGGIASRILKKNYFVNITGLGSAFQKDNLTLKVIKKLYRFSLKKSKKVFFENEGNKEIFINFNLIPSDKAIRLNGAGVNLEEYEFCEYNTHDNPLRFLFVGRVMKEKGIEELLKASKLIKEKYVNVEFDIVGPLEDDYKVMIDKYSNEGIINYHGYQTDVKKFIKDSHCIILPSYHEGMSNVLLEAGAIGRPIITTNIFGCKEAVIDEISGFLVKKTSSTDLFNKIEKFINLSYDSKIKLGIESRRHIVYHFNKVDVIYKTLEIIYK